MTRTKIRCPDGLVHAQVSRKNIHSPTLCEETMNNLRWGPAQMTPVEATATVTCLACVLEDTNPSA